MKVARTSYSTQRRFTLSIGTSSLPPIRTRTRNGLRTHRTHIVPLRLRQADAGPARIHIFATAAGFAGWEFLASNDALAGQAPEGAMHRA
jgi:hypothetical protein